MQLVQPSMGFQTLPQLETWPIDRWIQQLNMRILTLAMLNY